MKENKGITLIALIITIIIMLILVTVSIQVALNTGLFENAGKSARKTEDELAKEAELANITENATVNDLINKYKGEENINVPSDFYVYEDVEKTILVGINEEKYIQEVQETASNLQEGTKIASLNPIVIASEENVTYRKIMIDNAETTQIAIPEGVVEIKAEAFEYVLVEKVILPSTLKIIGNKAFSNCKILKEISIPRNVTTVGEGVFNNATGIINVPFLEGRKPAGWDDNWIASSGVSVYPEVKFATATIDGIYKYADPEKTIVIGINEEYLVEDTEVAANDISKGIKVASLQKVKIAWYNGNYYHIKVNNETVKDLIIPEGVVEIDTNAFAGLLIENVELPSTLRIIGNDAFSGCKILETIEIPSGVTTVGERVFRGSTGTVTVHFKDGERPSGWSSHWLDTYAETAPTVQYAQ